jgi:outer membrane protein assembly factor BamA
MGFDLFMVYRRFLPFLFLSLLPIIAFAQPKTLKMSTLGEAQKLTERYGTNLGFIVDKTGNTWCTAPDSAALLGRMTRLVSNLREAGYLTTSLDGFSNTASDTLTARLYTGPLFRLTLLRAAVMPPVAAGWVREATKFDLSEEVVLRPATVVQVQDNIVRIAGQRGYPFASTWLDSIEIDTVGNVKAMLQVSPNRFMTIKAVKTIGTARMPRNYIEAYLDIRPGQVYDALKINRLSEQLRQLPFVQMSGAPTVSFTPEGATVNLFLEKKRAGRFDFLLGLLPQPNDAAGRVLLTGTLDAAFQNAFNLGERLEISFERLRPSTQQLELRGSLPYIVGLPFGVDGHIDVFRNDSLWVDVQSEIGVQYLFGSNNFLKLYWDNRNLSVQAIDTLAVLRTRQLPPNQDLLQSGLGLGWSFVRFDYRFNPRKGVSLTGRISGGTSQSRPNNQIESLRDPARPGETFAALYDSLARRNTRVRAELQANVFIPIFRRTTIKLAVQGSGIFSNTPIFNNEQYRIGGFKMLRGFDEESIFTTRHLIGTAELRLLISQNAFLAAFADYGYAQGLVNRRTETFQPLGLGAGFNLETQTGIFGFNVAVGRLTPAQGVSWAAPKIHLGYVSLF